MQAHHRVPAMLNFSAGIQNLLLACRTAQIKHVYTSKRFIELADLKPAVDALKTEGIIIHYLEDERAKIGIGQKLLGKLFSFFPQYYYRFYNRINKHNEYEFPEKAAVILFTSGSEGVPKGVLLSHQNIQANR